ncbi:hypothetical protein [Cytobacillus firmus]|uniref:hypothetical protein n=1 Tax=Cytobacillus firmus TaxID=1399 RepID=UPI001559ACD7|nr:hypothetical protein [Cytobacillus firmus]
MITYSQNIDDGLSFKASLTEIFKAASGEYGKYMFTKEDLDTTVFGKQKMVLTRFW